MECYKKYPYSDFETDNVLDRPLHGHGLVHVCYLGKANRITEMVGLRWRVAVAYDVVLPFDVQTEVSRVLHGYYRS